VKTDQGWVLEFQHSYINPQEQKSREDFYQNLIWIVDGTRRKRDKSQFRRAFEEGRLVVKEVNMWRLFFPDECTLLREWASSSAPVFFDFSVCSQPEDTQLWCLIRVTDGMAYVGPLSREKFIEYHSPNATMDPDFAGLLDRLHAIVDKITQQPRQVGPSDARVALLRATERKYQQRKSGKRKPF
jgi:competence protein CoiA